MSSEPTGAIAVVTDMNVAVRLLLFVSLNAVAIGLMVLPYYLAVETKITVASR